MKKKEDIYVRGRVHTWTTKLDDDRLKDWAKMLGKALKSKKLISKGSSYHYVNPSHRYCISASVPVIVLDPKKKDKFFKKKTRKKK